MSKAKISKTTTDKWRHVVALLQEARNELKAISEKCESEKRWREFGSAMSFYSDVSEILESDNGEAGMIAMLNNPNRR